MISTIIPIVMTFHDVHEITKCPILMAVHECAINAICHGNKEDLQKQVGLSLSVHPDRLEIRVRDQGKSFNPNDVPDPLDKENLMKPAGRGILLIQAFMDGEPESSSRSMRSRTNSLPCSVWRC